MSNDFSWLSRTELLCRREGLEKLAAAHVMVVGMGGVGSYAAEFICRAGVGKMTIIDGDTVDNTNRNRQLPALRSTVGSSKVQYMADRLKDINPEVELIVHEEFIRPERIETILSSKPDYIIDAIDSITPKITFLSLAHASGIPIVSSMGAGGKWDPTKLKVVDISKTYQCPFAQQIRKNLKKKGIYKGITTVFSNEKHDKDSIILTDGSNYKKSAYGTISYLPATFGAVVASVVIRRIVGISL